MFEFIKRIITWITTLIIMLIQTVSNIFTPSVTGSNDEELTKLQNFAAGCAFTYTPSNAHMKTVVNADKLKVISYSIFRPYLRNIRYNEYMSGLERNAKEFPKIFPQTEGWIMRIYTDGTLVNQMYEYDENHTTFRREDHRWASILRQLKALPYVQIVDISCEKLRDDKHPEYHRGYFVTCARYFPMFDDDVELFLPREMDAYASEVDKYHIDKWIASDKIFTLYRTGDYGTNHPRLNCILSDMQTTQPKTYQFLRDGRLKDSAANKNNPKYMDGVFACHWGAKRFCGDRRVRSRYIKPTDIGGTESWIYMPVILEALGHKRIKGFHRSVPEWSVIVNHYKKSFLENRKWRTASGKILQGPLLYRDLVKLFDSPNHLPGEIQDALINDNTKIERSLVRYIINLKAFLFADGDRKAPDSWVCDELAHKMLTDLLNIKNNKILKACQASDIDKYKYGIDEVLLNHTILPYIVNSDSYYHVDMYTTQELLLMIRDKNNGVFNEIVKCFQRDFKRNGVDIYSQESIYNFFKSKDNYMFSRMYKDMMRSEFIAHAEELSTILPNGSNTLALENFFTTTMSELFVVKDIDISEPQSESLEDTVRLLRIVLDDDEITEHIPEQQDEQQDEQPKNDFNSRLLSMINSFKNAIKPEPEPEPEPVPDVVPSNNSRGVFANLSLNNVDIVPRNDTDSEDNNTDTNNVNDTDSEDNNTENLFDMFKQPGAYTFGLPKENDSDDTLFEPHLPAPKTPRSPKQLPMIPKQPPKIPTRPPKPQPQPLPTPKPQPTPKPPRSPKQLPMIPKQPPKIPPKISKNSHSHIYGYGHRIHISNEDYYAMAELFLQSSKIYKKENNVQGRVVQLLGNPIYQETSNNISYYERPSGDSVARYLKNISRLDSHKFTKISNYINKKLGATDDIQDIDKLAAELNSRLDALNIARYSEHEYNPLLRVALHSPLMETITVEGLEHHIA